MKFSLSWLKEHLETDATLEQICDTLPMLGLEVEELINPAEKLSPFTIAHVIEAPDACLVKIEPRVTTKIVTAGIYHPVCRRIIIIICSLEAFIHVRCAQLSRQSEYWLIVKLTSYVGANQVTQVQISKFILLCESHCTDIVITLQKVIVLTCDLRIIGALVAIDLVLLTMPFQDVAVLCAQPD